MSGGSFARTELAGEAGGNDGTCRNIRRDRRHPRRRIPRSLVRARRATLCTRGPARGKRPVQRRTVARRQSARRHAGAAGVDARQSAGRPTRGRIRRTIAWRSSTATGFTVSPRIRCSPAMPTSAGSPPAASTATSTATMRRPSSPTRRSTCTRPRRPARWGASLQLTLQRTAAGIAHQLVFGAAYDAGSDRLHAKRPARDLRGGPRHHRYRRIRACHRRDDEQPVARTLCFGYRCLRAAMEPAARGSLQHGAHRHAGPDRRVAGRSTGPTPSGASIPRSG